jgi:hypothetical protein
VQRDGAHELDVVRDHVPGRLRAREHDLLPHEATGRLLHRRERLRQQLVQHRRRLRLQQVLDLVDLSVQPVALVRVLRAALRLTELRQLILQLLRPLPDDPPELLRLPLQLLLGQGLKPLRRPVDLVHQRLQLLRRPLVAVAEDLRGYVLQGIQHVSVVVAMSQRTPVECYPTAPA